MAEQKVGVKLEVKGGKETENAFKGVGKSAEGFSKQAGTLTGTLKKLVVAAVGLFAFRQIANFIKEATVAAGIAEVMEARLASSLRTSTGATIDQIKSLIDYASALQKTTMYGDEQIVSAMGILSTFQLNTEQIKEATVRMLDMAAGTERATGEQQDLVSIAMALGKALTMGVGALTRYGVVMSESEKQAITLATGNEKLMLILGALDKNYAGIAEAMAKTYTGQLKIFENAWGDLKEEIGFGVLPVLSETIKALTKTSDVMDEGKPIALALFDALAILARLLVGLPMIIRKVGISFDNLWLKSKLSSEGFIDMIPGLDGNIEKMVELQKAIEKNDKAYSNIDDEMAELLISLQKERDNVKEGKRSWEEMLETIKGGAPIVEEAGEDIEAMASKIESAFGLLAKTVISQIENQISGIRDLRFELEGLSEDTDEQLGASEDRYQENLKRMARAARERIEQINEQIEDAREARNLGWRGEIIELEHNRNEQEAIIARIGGEIIDIQAEIRKDELTILQEAHKKEIDEIKEQAKRKELEIQKEILERQIAATRGAIEVRAPGFFEKAVGVETALRPWEVSPYQNIFNFSFEGEVSDRDALIKVVMEAINRASELKQFGGE